MKNYRKTMRESMDEAFSLNGSFIMNPEIFNSKIFLEYKNRFIENLKRIKELYPDYIVALENDFVGIGSGLQRPQEILELLDDLWFDLGHFWCSSLVHEFDFYEYSDRIIEEKNIVGVHINHNLMGKKTMKENIVDSHAHLYEKSEQDLKNIVRKLLSKGVDIFTLEITNGDIEDVKIILDWLS